MTPPDSRDGATPFRIHPQHGLKWPSAGPKHSIAMTQTIVPPQKLLVPHLCPSKDKLLVHTNVAQGGGALGARAP